MNMPCNEEKLQKKKEKIEAESLAKTQKIDAEITKCSQSAAAKAKVEKSKKKEKLAAEG